MGDPPAGPRPDKPVRPSTASAIRSPLDILPTPAPRSVLLSSWTWIASGLIPLLAIIYSFTKLDDVRAHLRATAVAETPTATEASLDRVVDVTVLTAIAALAAPIVVVIALAIVMVKRQNWARIMLLLIGLAAVPAAALAFEALSEDAPADVHNLTIGIAVQALVILAAVVLMFRPSANRWFRTRRRR